MGKRGPAPSIDYDAIAFCCRRAHATGRSMSLAVSSEFNVSQGTASNYISKARAAGYMVPLVRPDLVSDDPHYLPLGVYEDLFTPEPWMKLGECRDLPPALFFPERGDDVKQAKAVCDGCVVKDECLDYALRRGEKHGVWGGTSERERRTMRREIRVEAHSAA